MNGKISVILYLDWFLRTDTVKKGVTFKLCSSLLFFGYEICEMRNKIPYKISNNNAQVTVHLLIIVISWFAGLSAWSSKKVMNLTERGESFFDNGMKIFTNEYSYFHATSFSSLKVSKSPKNFSWNSIAQKTNKILDKILPYEVHFLGVLRAMEFLEKMLTTDLLAFKGQLISKENSKLFISKFVFEYISSALKSLT